MTPKTHADKKASGIEHADTLGGDDVRDVVAERAQWEDMTFAIGGNGLVVVANESHGAENAGEHTYVVIVEDGAAVECTCPECACLCEIDPDGPGCFEHFEGGDA